MAEGWQGWDDYAPFYDWENAQTLARRDVRSGSGSPRRRRPGARARVRHRPADDSGRAHRRARGRHRPLRRRCWRGRGSGCGGPSCRHCCCAATSASLPFRRRTRFDLVMAPYGMLQSLTTRARPARSRSPPSRGVLPRGGLFAIDLVPDLPRWAEYDRRVSLSGRRGRGQVRLTESVRQDRRKGLTIFDQEYEERRGGRRAVEALLADVPHDLGRGRCGAGSSAPASRSTPCSATTTAARSTRAPTSGSSSRESADRRCSSCHPEADGCDDCPRIRDSRR